MRHITSTVDDPQPTVVAEYADHECKTTIALAVYRGGREWNACSRDAAILTYEYAQMATNVYSDAKQFDLGSNFELLEGLVETDSGLAYQVYRRVSEGGSGEVIISFRGTDFDTWQDWIFGNIGLRQRAEALTVFDRVSREYGALPSVTGHSLGGALATQVSLCRDVHYSIVFDTSSRFSERFCGATYKNHNVSIVEYGEVNKLLRIFGREPSQRYLSLGCLQRGNSIDQHSMGKLAACLTNIAAIEASSAQSSRARNEVPDQADDWYAERFALRDRAQIHSVGGCKFELLANELLR